MIKSYGSARHLFIVVYSVERNSPDLLERQRKTWECDHSKTTPCDGRCVYSVIKAHGVSFTYSGSTR